MNKLVALQSKKFPLFIECQYSYNWLLFSQKIFTEEQPIWLSDFSQKIPFMKSNHWMSLIHIIGCSSVKNIPFKYWMSLRAYNWLHFSQKIPFIYWMSLIYIIGCTSVKAIPFIYWMSLIHIIGFLQSKIFPLFIECHSIHKGNLLTSVNQLYEWGTFNTYKGNIFECPSYIYMLSWHSIK